LIWVEVNLENVSKAGNPPMKQSKNLLLMCEIMHAMFEQVMIMLLGIFGQAVLGLCECARRTDSAFCRTTVDGKLIEVLATRCTSNYVCDQFDETCCCGVEQI
jgi:hypothetical protein